MEKTDQKQLNYQILTNRKETFDYISKEIKARNGKLYADDIIQKTIDESDKEIEVVETA